MSNENPIVFAELVGRITESRAFLSETAEMMSGEMRSQFESLLKLADEHFENFKNTVPDCLNTLKKKSEELSQRHDQNVTDLADANQRWEAIKQQIASGDVPPLQAAPEKPVAAQLGSFLRDELLNKFVPQTNPVESNSDVAWRDWNLEGSWIAPDASTDR